MFNSELSQSLPGWVILSWFEFSERSVGCLQSRPLTVTCLTSYRTFLRETCTNSCQFFWPWIAFGWHMHWSLTGAASRAPHKLGYRRDIPRCMACPGYSEQSCISKGVFCESTNQWWRTHPDLVFARCFIVDTVYFNKHVLHISNRQAHEFKRCNAFL
jgi:hypothetical protein